MTVTDIVINELMPVNSTTVTDQNAEYDDRIEFQITKKHSIEAEYLFQSDYLPRISDINIMSINYNIKF